jgi:PAS domain S-box-containing protein
MNRESRFRSLPDGRDTLLAVGALYVALALAHPWLAGVEAWSGVNLVTVLLVGGPGAGLLYVGYALPRTDIHPELHATVRNWCLGGIAAMLGLLGLVALAAELTNPIQNVLILTALGSVAGVIAGSYAARAKTRTRTLERRNRKLEETKVELEETVARLEESEQRYRTLTENFPNGAVALLNEELRHTLVAGRALAEVGFDASSLRGERAQDVYSAELLEVAEPKYRATLEGESTSFEVELRGRTFEFRTHPLTDDDGAVYAILAMSQDITERKQRERELAKRARQQQVVADLGQFALETDDLDELMDEASRQVADALDTEYCKVLDYDACTDELLLRQGVGWNDGLVGAATVSAVESDSQAAYTLTNDHPIVVEDLETETRFSGPELLTDHGVRSGISTIVGSFDAPWGILGTHDTAPREFSDQDVSFVKSVANVLAEAIERHQYQAELRQLVTDLEQSNERLEQFAYAASHDLQEPLRMVSSYLQLIESRYDDEFDEDGREFLEFAVNGAERMRSMIDGLLTYSRVETEADPLGPVELDAVLEAVREDLQVAIETSDATILADSLPRVEGDPHQLRQVFQNLLDNAIAYSGDESPTIDVSARRNGSDWIITVQDDGIGIDPAYQDSVFEVFERAHAPGGEDGTGIGLAICERIVERHDGEIWVESEPGEGTSFSFTLPAAASEAREPRDSRRTT